MNKLILGDLGSHVAQLIYSYFLFPSICILRRQPHNLLIIAIISLAAGVWHVTVAWPGICVAFCRSVWLLQTRAKLQANRKRPRSCAALSALQTTIKDLYFSDQQQEAALLLSLFWPSCPTTHQKKNNLKALQTSVIYHHGTRSLWRLVSGLDATPMPGSRYVHYEWKYTFPIM